MNKTLLVFAIASVCLAIFMRIAVIASDSKESKLDAQPYVDVNGYLATDSSFTVTIDTLVNARQMVRFYAKVTQEQARELSTGWHESDDMPLWNDEYIIFHMEHILYIYKIVDEPVYDITHNYDEPQLEFVLL